MILTSSVKFEDTKSAGSWKLFNDGYSYIKEYNKNTNYNTEVTNINGITTNVNIFINQINDEAPVITIEYKFLDDGRILVNAKSNKRLLENKNTSEWTLSDDQLTYSRIYDPNVEENYTTAFTDLHNNEVNEYIGIKIKNDYYNQNDNSSLNIKYVYCSNDIVYVILNSSTKFADTKSAGGWKLFNSGYSYIKEYSENTVYQTSVKNINGATTSVTIMVNYFKSNLDGIDVSSWNGTIDWARVKNAGIDFAIVRIGFRGYGTGSLNQDKNFEYNIKNAAAYGIKVGVYFFSQAVNDGEAIEEANYVYEILSKYNVQLQYPIVLDVEQSGDKDNEGRADNISVNDRTNVCIAFAERIKSLGYTPMIYSNKVWLNSYIDTSRLNYDIWLAQYISTPTYNGIYTMWQYTSSGSVDGISGNVDLIHSYKKY